MSVWLCVSTLRSGQASCVCTPRRGPKPAGMHTAAGPCYAWSGFASASAESASVTELLLCSVVQCVRAWVWERTGRVYQTVLDEWKVRMLC